MDLKIPLMNLKLREINGTKQVYDIFRSKWIPLTEEEFVRQNFLHWLMKSRNYPISRIKTEVFFKTKNNTIRCDAIIYDKSLNPLMIIEFKSPFVKISQQTFDQIGIYNIELKVKYLLISNGIDYYCFLLNHYEKKIEQLLDIPHYNELL